MSVRGWKDLLLVAKGTKPCALLTVPESDVLDTIMSVEGMGLKYSFSSRKLVNRHNVSIGHYTYQRSAVSLDSAEEGDILVYVFKTDSVLVETRSVDIERNDKLTGALFGYPHCCIDYFCNRFDRFQFNNSILKMIETYLAVDINKVYPFVMNIFARFYGQSILSHYPCRLDCESSIELGYQYLSSLRSADPEMARQIEDQSRCIIAINPGSGLLAFRRDVLEKRGNQSVATYVHWDIGRERNGAVKTTKVLARPVPDGICMIDEMGREEFHESYIFDFQ